ncbi:hypothetical protein GCM10009760_06340 [Kitasatospora kazusensis]|uniref:Uncharacterized protein n=1 Tax=Kitasatospora kazusensis TaxID=407974 RepID=A0ABN2YV77_9ACTN
MRNPFRADGPVQRTMPFLGLALAVDLYLQSRSLLWALSAGVMAVPSCHEIYRQIRSYRRK